MDFEIQSNIDTDLLKAKVGQFEIKEVIQPHFLQLLKDTLDPEKLARILFKKGVMSKEEMEEVTDEWMILFQNLEVYRAVKRTNAGKHLIDALCETGNFQILQLLQTDVDNLLGRKGKSTQKYLSKSKSKDKTPSKQNLNIDPNQSHEKLTQVAAAVAQLQVSDTPGETSQESSMRSFKHFPYKKISILKTVESLAESQPQPEKCIGAIKVANFDRLHVADLDQVLVRVSANTTCDETFPLDDHQKMFNAYEFDQTDEKAIVNFLEYLFQPDLDKVSPTVTSPPCEIYINTGSFTPEQWNSLSKFLFDYCPDSLEHLWLDNVDYANFSQGTKWMNAMVHRNKSKLWFSKLKVFIFQGNHEVLDSQTFHDILKIVKPKTCSLYDLWNRSGCEMQISKEGSESCQILIDPFQGTLFVNGVAENLRDEVDNKSDPRMSKGRALKKSGQPIVKLYYEGPRINFFTTVDGINPRLLTHLFLFSWTKEGVHVIKEVIKNLGQFRLLQKLGLERGGGWTIDLRQLHVLDKLEFLYLDSAEVNCGGVGMDLFPWRPSIQTVILDCCEVTLKTPGLAKMLTQENCLRFERIYDKNVKQYSPFKVSKLSFGHVNLQKEFMSS